MENIKEHLSDELVIWNRDDNVEKPKHLMFLDWAHDHKGEPMFGNKRDYVSKEYPNTVREALFGLGVTAPSWDWMCDELRKLHFTNLLNIKMQSKHWCSDLAKVILEPKGLRGNIDYARDLRGIPLIPLTNGTWRCPPSENDPIYFPVSLGTTIPPGLRLSLVDEEACLCPKRKKLFTLLGVKECNVLSVIERVLDYHTNFSFAQRDHIIAQLKYLYSVRDYLRPGDMDNIYFACSASSTQLHKGASTYANTSENELQQLLSGCSEAHFLDDHYFTELSLDEKAMLAEWLRDKAGVALAPRFIATYSNGLHKDFQWLLDNKSDQALATLRRYWSIYDRIMTSTANRSLQDHEVMCIGEYRCALAYTCIPTHTLMEKARTFGNANRCHFLLLPGGNPEDWAFLSSFGVGIDDGLDFYLWMLKQPGFQENINVHKSEQLYLAIQSRVFSSTDEENVR